MEYVSLCLYLDVHVPQTERQIPLELNRLYSSKMEYVSLCLYLDVHVPQTERQIPLELYANWLYEFWCQMLTMSKSFLTRLYYHVYITIYYK